MKKNLNMKKKFNYQNFIKNLVRCFIQRLIY